MLDRWLKWMNNSFEKKDQFVKSESTSSYNCTYWVYPKIFLLPHSLYLYVPYAGYTLMHISLHTLSYIRTYKVYIFTYITYDLHSHVFTYCVYFFKHIYIICTHSYLQGISLHTLPALPHLHSHMYMCKLHTVCCILY